MEICHNCNVPEELLQLPHHPGDLRRRWVHRVRKVDLVRHAAHRARAAGDLVDAPQAGVAIAAAGVCAQKTRSAPSTRIVRRTGAASERLSSI